MKKIIASKALVYIEWGFNPTTAHASVALRIRDAARRRSGWRVTLYLHKDEWHMPNVIELLIQN